MTWEKGERGQETEWFIQSNEKPTNALRTSPTTLMVLVKAPSFSSSLLAPAELVGRADPDAEAEREAAAADEATVEPEPTAEALAMPGAAVGAASGAVDWPSIWATIAGVNSPDIPVRL
jgi:hypothetical protein